MKKKNKDVTKVNYNDQIYYKRMKNDWKCDKMSKYVIRNKDHDLRCNEKERRVNKEGRCEKSK